MFSLPSLQQAADDWGRIGRMASLPVALGTILLLHAAYATVELKQLLSTSTATASARLPPVDVVVEVGVAFLLVLLGLLSSTASFQPIKLSEDISLRSADLYDTRPDFISFAHRGRAGSKQ